MIDELIASAELGEEAKKFIASDLGRYVLGAAKQDAQLALEKMGELDPSNTEEIRKAQNEWKLNLMFERWLAEALHNGEEAKRVFEQQQESS